MASVFNTYDFKISHPDRFKQLAVKDILFVHYQCPQVDKHVHLFTHYNEIVYTLSGKRIIHHQEKSWPLTDDKSLFVRRTAYNQELPGVVGWEVLAFYFSDDLMRQVFREFRKQFHLNDLPLPPTDMLIEININETTRAFFYGMLPYFTQPVSPSENLLELKFKELLFNLLSDPANQKLLAYIQSIEGQTKTPLSQIMEANYMFNLSISEFAKMAERSVASFKREFQYYYHTSPGRWLANKRLEYAKMLLDRSNKSVSEIAWESGFENITHFSRVFKSKFNQSPLQYRRSIGCILAE